MSLLHAPPSPASRSSRIGPALRLALPLLAWTLLAVPPAATQPATAAPTAIEWPLGSVEDHARDPERLLATVERIGEMEGIYGLLVVRDQELVVERYFREAYREKPHNLKSASKSVLSALAGIAAAEGLLDLERPIADYLPEVRGLTAGAKGEITVRHLLTMTAGLEATSYETYNEWIQARDWVRAALKLPLVAAPGSRFQYSTGNTHLLSAVLTRAVGRPTRDYAEEKLFGPLGVEVRGWERDPQGIYVGGNNLSLLPRDMARFGQLYLDGGRHAGSQVVPAAWVAQSTATTERGLHPVYGTYGLLWWTDLVYEGAFVAVGYGGQYIYVSPPHRAVVVVTSTLESKGSEWTAELFEHLRIGILAALGPSPDYYAERGLPLGDPAIESLAGALDRARAAIGVLGGAPDRRAGELTARTAARVNLRRRPETGAPRLALLERSRPVEVIDRANGWLQVRAGDQTGWLHGDYVELEGGGWRAAAAELRGALAAFADAVSPYFGGAWPAASPSTGPTSVRTASQSPADGDRLRALEGRLEASERARAALAQRAAELETALADAATVRDRAGKLSAELSEARELLAGTVAERDAALGRAAGLDKEIEAMRKRLVASAEAREGREQPDLELRELLAGTVAERDAALERVAALEGSLLGVRGQLTASEANRRRGERLAAELAEARAELAGRSAAVEAAEGRATALAEELDETRAQLAAAESGLADSRLRADDLASELRELVDQAVATERSQEQLVAKLSDQLGETRDLLEASARAANAAEDRASRLEAELESAIAARESATAEATEAAMRGGPLTAELETVTARLVRAEAKAQAASERVERLEAEAGVASERVESLETDLAGGERLVHELALARERVQELEATLAASDQRALLAAVALTDLGRRFELLRDERAAIEAERDLLAAGAAAPETHAAPPSVERGVAAGEEAETEHRERPAIAGGAVSVRRVVEAWAEAWSARDVDRYLGHYSARFETPDGIDLGSWKRRRRLLIEGARSIEVEISDLQIAVLTEDQVRVRFRQGFRSEERLLTTWKTLDLVLENGRWRIVAEKSVG